MRGCWAHYPILWPLFGFCWSYKESSSWWNENRLLYLLKMCVTNSPVTLFTVGYVFLYSPLPLLSPGLTVPSSPSLSPASHQQLGWAGCTKGLRLIERSGDKVVWSSMAACSVGLLGLNVCCLCLCGTDDWYVLQHRLTLLWFNNSFVSLLFRPEQPLPFEEACFLLPDNKLYFCFYIRLRFFSF